MGLLLTGAPAVGASSARSHLSLTAAKSCPLLASLAAGKEAGTGGHFWLMGTGLGHRVAAVATHLVEGVQVENLAKTEDWQVE